MAPQLASNTKWNGNYVFGGDVILQKPHLASLVAAVIAEWGLAETHLGRVFAYMIGAKRPITMSMYEAVKSFEVQRDLLRRVAEETISKRNSDIFAATLTVLNRASVLRHRFAHWIWGISADPDLDALLLVEQKHFWHLSIKQFKYHRIVGIVGVNTKIPIKSILKINALLPRLDPQNIYIYKEQDLVDAVKRMENTMIIADKLRRLVSLKGAQRQAIYRQLYNDADIRSALDRANIAPPKNNPTLSESPKKSARKRRSKG
ncbi:MAG: hypothetical protein WA231_13950 [Methylocella sp.]